MTSDTATARLKCEFAAAGYTPVEMSDMPSVGGYLAIKGQLDALLQSSSPILDWINDQLTGHEGDFVDTLTLTLAGPDLVALIQQTGLTIQLRTDTRGLSRPR